jgi:hypothetical protein
LGTWIAAVDEFAAPWMGKRGEEVLSTLALFMSMDALL